MWRFAIVLAVAVAGCTKVAVPREEPVETVVVAGDYLALADCTLLALQRSLGGITRVELPARAAVQLSESEYRLIRWTLTLERRDDGRTLATFHSVRAVWGETFYADQVMPALRSCAT